MFKSSHCNQITPPSHKLGSVIILDASGQKYHIRCSVARGPDDEVRRTRGDAPAVYSESAGGIALGSFSAVILDPTREIY